MRFPALVIGLLVALGPTAASESPKVAVVMPYHGSYDPHWIYMAHELPEKVQEILSVTYDEYNIQVYPGSFETYDVTKVRLQGGKEYVIHQEEVNTGEEVLKTELGHALKEAEEFTNSGRDGLIVVLPAFVNRGGQHQCVEIPEVIDIILGDKVPKYSVHYEPFGITNWDRQNDIGIVPELLFRNIQTEAEKTLTGPNGQGDPEDVFSAYKDKRLLDFLVDHKDEVGLLEIMFGTLRVGYWDDFKANAMYVLRGVAERLGNLLGTTIPVGEVDWALENPFVREGKAYFFAFQNPEIGPENWEKSRWEVRYEQFQKLMQSLCRQGVRYVVAFPYITVTGITDRKLFEGNPEHGPEGDEPEAYDYPEAILRHFGAELVAETVADVRKYTYVQEGQEKTRTVYINARIYRIPKEKLGTDADMYVIYVRRGLLDAPNATEKVARVYANYIATHLPTWLMEYEAVKGMKEGFEGEINSLRKDVKSLKKRKVAVYPAVIALALAMIPPLRRR
ncbi:hypothetical protein [Methanopyrus kandleri]|uniref:Uncharacterized protein n=2 Tax=Methanopyrus kandleri TaxID=2320 RepID=Q8TWI9_METKA|nr:hypothetical protein [Methanopyrus kandleri]AAM02258.1 Uncharacterized protein MK1045 [Methanopyrus kandleri AV19]HII69677.1 hypothetical protein [Methanopyrus kandleri]